MSTTKRKVRKVEDDHTPGMLDYLRTLAGPAFVIGGWQLIPTSYIAGALIVYLGFVVCLVEVIWEPVLLRRPCQLQVALVAIVFVAIAVFTISIVIVDAPLCFSTMATDIKYGEHEAPGGIEWIPAFSELDLFIANNTDNDYENINLLVRPDVPIAKIAQISSLPDVTFADRQGLIARATIEEVNKQAPIHLEFIATDVGYKIHCGKLPEHFSLNIIMALAAPQKTVPPQQGFNVPPGASLANFTVVTLVKNDDGEFKYWYGSPQNLIIYGPPPKCTSISIRGSYIAKYHTKTVDQVIRVGAKMGGPV